MKSEGRGKEKTKGKVQNIFQGGFSSELFTTVS